MLGRRLQHAPAVPPRYIVNERAEPGVIRQHENIQRGVPAGHLVHLGQGELDRLGGRRPVEPGPPVALQVGRRLAVGHDQDDRLVLRVPVDVAAGQHQRVVQVGALHHVPAQPGQLGLAQFARVVGEADDLDGVLRELAAQQRVQRERGLLGRRPGPAQLHRVGQVDEQGHDRGAAALGLGHLEVARLLAGGDDPPRPPPITGGCPSPVPPAGARPRCALRSRAFRTVAGTSSGCSSPNSQARVVPVSSPAWPASRRSWSPDRPKLRSAKIRRSAVSPSLRTALGVSSSCPALRVR